MSPSVRQRSTFPQYPELSIAPAFPSEDAPDAMAAALLAAECRAASRLAAGAAYELDPPLTEARTALRALVESVPAAGADPRADLLRRALASVEKVDETVRGLRAFTRFDDAPNGIDVHEAIELAIHFAGAALDTRAVLHRSYAPVVRARGNLVALASALTHLLANAAQAIPSSLPHANTITVGTSLTPDGRVAIEVTDTGVGIEPEDVPFVFDPFFTTKPTATSPGLGLSTAHAAIVAMGGTLRVESTVGRGSTFRIELRAGPASERPARAFHERERAPHRRVLCVGDTAESALRMGMAADARDTHVLFATHDEACERLALGEVYDLVLCEAGPATARFRARIARLAPDALARAYALALPAHAGDMDGQVPPAEASRTSLRSRSSEEGVDGHSRAGL